MKSFRVSDFEFSKRKLDGAWCVWALLTNLDHPLVHPQWILLNVSDPSLGLEGLKEAELQAGLTARGFNFKYPYPED